MIPQSVECLAFKYEFMSLISRIHFEKKSWVWQHVIVIPVLGKGCRDPWGLLASKPSLLRELQPWEALFQKERWRASEERQPRLSPDLYICTCAWTHRQTRLHANKLVWILKSRLSGQNHRNEKTQKVWKSMDFCRTCSLCPSKAGDLS